MTIVGYVHDAALHCVGCTHDRFHGAENRDAKDSEGNDVQPILDISEG